MNTYTGMGNTPQAQSTQRFYEALRAIQGVSPMAASPEDLQTGQISAQSAQLGLQANQGQNMANAQSQLQQNAGIPNLVSQFGDLSGAFKMFLADQNMAQKYANQQNTNPWNNAGLVAAGQGNPYMAPLEEIAATTQPAGTGFTNPSLVTQAMGAPVSATTKMLDLLQSALTGQTNQVNQKTDVYAQNYQGAMNALGNVADMFGTERERRAAEQKANKKNYQAVSLGDGKVVFWDPETGEIVNKYGAEGSSFGQKMSDEARGYIDSIKNNISWGTVGPAGKTIGNIPGTPAYDFAQQVEGLKGNLRVTTLSELKAMGGTMGQLSNEEGRALESAIGKLDIGQSPDAFKKQIDKIENYLIKAYAPASGGTGTNTKLNVNASSSTTQKDGTIWKQNSDGSYTRIK